MFVKGGKAVGFLLGERGEDEILLSASLSLGTEQSSPFGTLSSVLLRFVLGGEGIPPPISFKRIY